MIYHACEPRSQEWHALRLGIPTSSEFHKIITPKTMKLSSQAPAYMYRLIAEWVTGEQVENFASQWMDRGTELEDSAKLAYEALTDTETSPGGFITTDDGLLGCSPDRLIGEEGDLELKCPLIQTQVGYALGSGVDEEYMAQLQGRMMITGRQWVDIFSYHPRLVIPVIRVKRDEKYIGILRPVMQTFVDLLIAKRLELEQKYGPFLRPEPEPEPDYSRDFISEDDVEAIIAANKLDELKAEA